MLGGAERKLGRIAKPIVDAVKKQSLNLAKPTREFSSKADKNGNKAIESGIANSKSKDNSAPKSKDNLAQTPRNAQREAIVDQMNKTAEANGETPLTPPMSETVAQSLLKMKEFKTLQAQQKSVTEAVKPLLRTFHKGQETKETSDSSDISHEKPENPDGIQTRLGRNIEVLHWKNATDNRTIPSRKEEMQQLQDFFERNPDFKDKITIIEFAEDSREFNCHGRTIGKKAGWIDNPDVQKYLDDNCEKIDEGSVYHLPSSDKFRMFEKVSKDDTEKYLIVLRKDPEKLRYSELRHVDDHQVPNELDKIYKQGKDIEHSANLPIFKNDELYVTGKSGLSEGVREHPFRLLSRYAGLFGSKYEIYRRKPEDGN